MTLTDQRASEIADHQDLRPMLYVHIGAHKTGTSALQSFLARNAAALEERGVLYPPSHTSSLASAGRTTSGNGSSLILHMQDAQHVKGAAFRKRFEHQLCRSSARIVLLSSEMFWGAGFRLLPQVVELATQAGRETRIIVYLRPQSEAIVSAWSERVKRQGFTGTPSEFFRNLGAHFDYLPKLDILESLFGRDRLTVRPYSRDAFTGGDLVTDFLTIFGLDGLRDRHDAPLVVNTSLSEPEIALFRALNRIGVNTRALANLFDEVPAPAAGVRTPLDKTLAEAIKAAYAASNAEIAKRFFGGRDWLSRPVSTGRPRDDELAEDDRTLAVFLARAAEKLMRLEQARFKEAERNSCIEARLGEQAEAIRRLEARIQGARLGDS